MRSAVFEKHLFFAEAGEHGAEAFFGFAIFFVEGECAVDESEDLFLSEQIGVHSGADQVQFVSADSIN